MGTLRSRIRPGMMDGEAARVLDDAARAHVEESRSRVHVISGNLRDSIRATTSGRKQRTVIADATNSSGDGYASFEEYGTRYRPGHPFWEPGQRAAQDEIRAARLRP